MSIEDDLLDRHAVFIAGYDLGMAQGRAEERATIDWETQAREAAARAIAITELPEADPARKAGRDETRRQHGWER